MNKHNLRIVFFGTPEFAVASLKKILEEGFDVVAVVTMPDKIAGRGHKLIESDVKKFAVGKGLKILQPEKLKSQDFIEELKSLQADIFVVIAFRMLPQVVWSMPRLGTFNLHASLLPKYRGAAPINRAVMNGETETGVTTFFLKHEIDTGNIIQQKKIEILPSDNAGCVHDKLMVLGADMVVDTLKEIEKGNIITVPQPEGDHIPAPKIFKDTCRIDWNQPASVIHNHIRGLAPYPAAWSFYRDDRNPEELAEMKIFASAISNLPELENLNPGEITILKDRLFISTSDIPLEILSLQPAGKKPMEAAAFLRGYKPLIFS